MKASAEQLEQLWQIQKLIFDQRRLVAEAKKLSSGESLTSFEKEITDLAELARNQVMKVESLQAEKRRIESDLELVEKRIQTDQQRLNASSSSKDITGIQHEIDGLEQRKSMLEDTELGILSELQGQEAALSEIQNLKSSAEQRLAGERRERPGAAEDMSRLRQPVAQGSRARASSAGPTIGFSREASPERAARVARGRSGPVGDARLGSSIPCEERR